MITEVRIRSRKDMQQEAYVIDKPCFIISIHDLDKYPIRFPVNHEIRDAKSFAFEDIDDASDLTSISNEDARNIANYVRKYADKSEDLICYVNCEAGLSRSAGVAAAISKYFLGDDSWVFKTKYPNMLCYRRVLEALHTDPNAEAVDDVLESIRNQEID